MYRDVGVLSFSVNPKQQMSGPDADSGCRRTFDKFASMARHKVRPCQTAWKDDWIMILLAMEKEKYRHCEAEISGNENSDVFVKYELMSMVPPPASTTTTPLS